jgi:NADH-quinone oxidoreductase subunit A
VVALVISLAVIFGVSFLGPKRPNKYKNSVIECGVPPSGDAKKRFSVRFYLVALSFLLFDVEVVFFYPFAVVYKEFLSINSFILVEMGLFVAILLVGYFYVLKKGALEWE